MPQVHCRSDPHQTWHKDCSGVCHHNINTRGPIGTPGFQVAPRGPLLPEEHHCSNPHQSWQSTGQGSAITIGTPEAPYSPQGPVAARCTPLLRSTSTVQGSAITIGKSPIIIGTPGAHVFQSRDNTDYLCKHVTAYLRSKTSQKQNLRCTH